MNPARFGAAVPLALLALCACASTPGAQPHQMSAAQHEAAAATAERQAAAENQGPAPSEDRCSFLGPSGQPAGACWTDVSSPTRERAERADQFRKAAAEHRAASQALRDAEARACAGLASGDRDVSPFAHREDIAGVEPLYNGVMSGKSQYARLQGATITFRAVPGMTAEWLQRIVDCHIARNAALGHDAPEMSFCPLQPNGVSAQVTPAGGGFAVAIKSDDSDAAREVLRRAEALVGR